MLQNAHDSDRAVSLIPGALAMVYMLKTVDAKLRMEPGSRFMAPLVKSSNMRPMPVTRNT